VKRAAIIYNPVAGAGRAISITEQARGILSAQGFAVECVPTNRPGDAEPLARARASAIDLLGVAGGDGSIREAIAGLGEESRRVTVAILPCGNANVVARELGVPLDADGALEVLRSGTATPIDLGRIGSEIFLAMVGIGWDARTVRHLGRFRRTRMGGWWYRLWADSAYVLAGLAAVFVWPLVRIRITADGRAVGPLYCAAQIANFRCYGKGWSMVPDAHRASGRLHFQARKRAGPFFILWQLFAARFRRRTPRFISDHGDGTRLVVQADRPFPVQVDGDDWGSFTRIEIEIEPGAARVLSPETQ
jgi:diacylglycerol kinase family enzyme